MTAFVDLAGQRFGSLVAVSRAPNKHARVHWNCICDCGKRTVASSNNLRCGRFTSCGCSRITHGGAGRKDGKTPEYSTWAGMLQRCHNTGPRNRAWVWYGGRGITVCERWRHSFAAFLADMGPKPTPQHTLDRINNDGNYEPGNCRWAAVAEQNANKRSIAGERHPMARLTADKVRLIRADTRLFRFIAADFGISRSTVESIKKRRIWDSVP